MDGHDLEQLILGHDQLPLQGHFRDGVARALIDIDRDVHVGLVGRDRDLCRENLKPRKARVLIERLQRLEVAGELLFGVLVALGEPGQPAGRGQLEQTQQIVLGE